MDHKKCRYCGYTNPAENNFCASCGAPFDEMASKGKRNKTIKMKTVLLLCLAVTVAVNVIMALVLNSLVPPKTEDTSDKTCAHIWGAGSCTSPQVCTLCGKTGAVLGDHSWLPGDCKDPERCSICGEVRDGPMAEHSWLPASCTDPERCSVCEEVRGEPLGHVWTPASYSAPETCDVCKITSGTSQRQQLAEFLRSYLPITTYSTSTEEKVYGYEDAALTKKSEKRYFVPAIDELVITDISEDGSAVQVRYPSKSAASGHGSLWFPIEDIVPLVQIQIGKGETVNKRTTYRLDQETDAMVKYGVMSANSSYTVLGTHESGYTVVLYHITDTEVNGCSVCEKVALIEP